MTSYKTSQIWEEKGKIIREIYFKAERIKHNINFFLLVYNDWKVPIFN